MRRLPVAAVFAACFSALSATALALDVEVVSPAPEDTETPAAASSKSAGGPANPAAASDAAQADAAEAKAETEPSPIVWPVVETGSVEKHNPVPVTEASPAAAPAEPGLVQGLRVVLQAEIDASEAAAPTTDAAAKPLKTAEERDREALKAFYESRNDQPIWVSKDGLNAKAQAAIAEILRAGEWGIDASIYDLPKLKPESGSGPEPTRDDLVKAEMQLSIAVLKYHLHARGGAIYDAPKQISSYLDRRPQIRDRKAFLDELAAADDVAKILIGSHPQQPEFKRLHEAWRAAQNGARGKTSADALRANMQQWRLMPEDLGKFYVWVNVPEYLIRIVKDGEVIWTERITAGLVNKQTPIFSDAMERVTFKSKWRVPDSIKVKEVWPSLLRGGGMMRQHGLVMMRGETDEQVDWRKINWATADMNDYVLWQPPGPKNQLGVVKFSFPSKHRVFMHDTPDKYMFAWTRRANSHGCMRIRNPLAMATLILGNDKGWDRAMIDDLVKNGPNHNVIELDNKVPVHITYLTTRIGEDGKMQTFPDIYGHEKRVRQALAGQWQSIARGADHLAPLDQSRVPRVAASSKTRALRQEKSLTEMLFGNFN